MRKKIITIGWALANIKGISLLIYIHQILLEEGAKLVREFQQTHKPVMKEVFNKEALHLFLDQGIIYPIVDRKWVSPIRMVPKKTGFSLVPYEKNDIILMIVQNGWRCVSTLEN